MPTRNAKCRLFKKKKKKNPLQQCTPFQIQNIHQAREGRKSATAQKEFAAKQRASTGYVSPCNVGLPSLCRNKGAGWEERFLLQRISEKPALDVKEPFSGLSLRSIHPCSLVIHAKHSSPLVAPTILLSRINLRRKKRKSNEERERRGDSWTKRELAGPSTLLFRNRKLVCQSVARTRSIRNWTSFGQLVTDNDACFEVMATTICARLRHGNFLVVGHLSSPLPSPFRAPSCSLSIFLSLFSLPTLLPSLSIARCSFIAIPNLNVLHRFPPFRSIPERPFPFLFFFFPISKRLFFSFLLYQPCSDR